MDLESVRQEVLLKPRILTQSPSPRLFPSPWTVTGGSDVSSSGLQPPFLLACSYSPAECPQPSLPRPPCSDHGPFLTGCLGRAQQLSGAAAAPSQDPWDPPAALGQAAHLNHRVGTSHRVPGAAAGARTPTPSFLVPALCSHCPEPFSHSVLSPGHLILFAVAGTLPHTISSGSPCPRDAHECVGTHLLGPV